MASRLGMPPLLRSARSLAAALHISERTAENHVQHILTKLGLHTRTQIATWAVTQDR